ncbi:type II toxin-antitoxin system HipA family toxin [Roseateles oligotrophus]|uniref:Type II toxin-antitoxin system HipA family toxin n=1 Tax=Roseateles oligotrophus TaxID=1769250 RepID=A0ABT2YA90_9BURK|nr:type II toxin-antitoxin system HipA family toxin [Roseateles oligotrophus]MCV2367224.1 type II toxin-antitoxin system HipA family toxin [Roseateles oligotrophus]
MPKQLEVWLNGEQLGVLMQVDGRLGFAYTANWLQNPASQALSHSLPLRPEAFDDRATRPFFAGLLPEGDKRRLVAQALHVSRQNDFGLLDGIGGECAGAVSLREPRLPQPASNELAPGSESVRWLDEAQLQQLLKDLPQRPMLAGLDGLRLSLAGAQDKLPVTFDGHLVGLPLHGSPSTHILKPAISSLEGSVHNEAFCMRLAAAMQMPAAQVEIRHAGAQPFLLVRRYDRLPATGAAGMDATDGTADAPSQRLHQEDFCQAMGIVPEHKYQNEGGPSLAQAFQLLRQVTRPNAPQVLRLLDAVVFNALIGNHDAHGKNFSLLYGASATQPRVELAPLYDLLCTAVYPQLTDKMAMKIGSKYRFTELLPRHWEQFAHEADLSRAQVRKRVLDIANRLPSRAEATRGQMVAAGQDAPLLSDIVALINRRCALTAERLGK